MKIFLNNRFLRNSGAVLLGAMILSGSSGCSAHRTVLPKWFGTHPSARNSQPGAQRARMAATSRAPSSGVAMLATQTAKSPEQHVPEPVPAATSEVPAEVVVQVPPEPPTAVPEIQAEAVETLASKEELTACQQQMTDLLQRFAGLEEIHRQSEQRIDVMIAEQQRLRSANERLKQEIERNHQADIASLDALSEIIDEVVATAEPVESEGTVEPSDSVDGDEDIPVFSLPSVEGSL